MKNDFCGARLCGVQIGNNNSFHYTVVLCPYIRGGNKIANGFFNFKGVS